MSTQELVSIAAYESCIRAAADLQTLEDLHEDMIGHREHGCAGLEELRAYCLGYCAEWRADFYRNHG